MARSFGYRDFPEEVLYKAGVQAKIEKITLKALLEKVLREYLARHPESSGKEENRDGR